MQPTRPIITAKYETTLALLFSCRCCGRFLRTPTLPAVAAIADVSTDVTDVRGCYRCLRTLRCLVSRRSVAVRLPKHHQQQPRKGSVLKYAVVGDPSNGEGRQRKLLVQQSARWAQQLVVPVLASNQFLLAATHHHHPMNSSVA